MRHRRSLTEGLPGRHGACEFDWRITAASLFGISGNANGTVTRQATAVQHGLASGHEPLTSPPEQSQIRPPGECRAGITATLGA